MNWPITTIIIAIYKVHNSINKTRKSIRRVTKLVSHHRKIATVHGPDLVQAFQKKWWVESRFYSAPNLPLPLRHKRTSGGNQHRYADVKVGKVETKHQDKL